MTRRGKVSSISNGKIKVTFPDTNNNVTVVLPVCAHVGSLHVNDIVFVVFWNDNMADGVIIGKVD